MRRVNSYNYKLRSLLILIPLILLAIVTWSLNRSVTPDIAPDIRVDFLLAARTIFPWLFAVAVSFSVPTFDRMLQISSVTVIYFFTVWISASYNPLLFSNPTLCVITAVSTVLAFLPYESVRRSDYRSVSGTDIIRAVIYALLIPALTFIAAATVIRQVSIVVLYTFDDTFGKGPLSVIYVPIFIFLQTFGFHDIVGELLNNTNHGNIVASFINAVVITDMFSLPAVLFARSMSVKANIRLFLTLLMVITILTGSLGSCVSLTLMLLLIFYPGTFGILSLSAVFCGVLSFFMQVPAVTNVSNLYMPDLNLSHTILFFSAPVAVLEIFSVTVSVIMVFMSALIRKDQLSARKSTERSLSVGYSLAEDSSPELKLLALLRAFDGISNIVDVEADGAWLYVQVADRNRISTATLNVLTQDRLLIDRVNKIYLCETGEQSEFFCKRLSELIENSFGEDHYEVSVSVPFDFRSLSQDRKLS